MRLSQLAVVFPAMALIGASAFGDEPGPRAQRPSAQQYPQQQQAYPQPYYQDDQDQDLPPALNPGQQYYCVNNCAQAPMPYPPLEVEPVPLPEPIEPPMVIQPMPAPPIVINPPAIIYPPVALPPVVGRPVPYYRPGYRPYRQPRAVPYGGRGQMYRRGGPQAMPYRGARVRRMSTAASCEIQRGNSGEVLVLSKDDKVLYQDSSVHAEENARAMKTYYEGSDFEFCAETEDLVPKSNSSYDI